MLVAGASGCVGSAVVRRLLRQGREVAAMVRDTGPPQVGDCTSRPRCASRTHTGTGAGWALTLGNGRNVKAIRNAPRPTAQEPM
ncbi:MAG: NAD-dependent epimerase/dehydratase family protein [Alphaproteobacteria bacterium]|nr:MAG: NAD-dependent epimerase/dehydratase family protein [Alphaproteobacteria bacterium]